MIKSDSNIVFGKEFKNKNIKIILQQYDYFKCFYSTKRDDHLILSTKLKIIQLFKNVAKFVPG